MNRRNFITSSISVGTVLFLPHNLAEAGDNDDISPANVGSYCPNANEWALLREVNEWRAANGVGALQMSRSLSAAAHHHAYYMSQTDDIDHTLGSKSWYDNILDYGYPGGYGNGEDVAAGRQSAAGTVQLWKESPSHNAVMLEGDFIRMGGGRVYRSSGYYTYYWCATFGGVSHRTISSC